MNGASILVIDDDRAFRIATNTLLSDEGFGITLASNGEMALAMVQNSHFDLVLSDVVMSQLGNRFPETRENNFSGSTGDHGDGVWLDRDRSGSDASRCNGHLTKPCNNQELVIKIRRALEAGKKDRELRELREELRGVYSVGSMVSRSDNMKEVVHQIRRVADTDVTVLVQRGERDRKELVARALHFNSKRRDSSLFR
jgi:DNA-binding NtrC family response regulator